MGYLPLQEKSCKQWPETYDGSSEEPLPFPDRVYLPSQDGGVDAKECLRRYIEREFPDAEGGGMNAVYSVPSVFQKTGAGAGAGGGGNNKRQANLAEQLVFTRLHGLLRAEAINGLWIAFFHGASYAGRSYRNQRFGKLMIREHDFVIFAKYRDKHFLILTEIKSTHDSTTDIKNLEITSDSKVIKNNRRSAQHQLRDHLEILGQIADVNCIQRYIMWPFLGAVTRSPRNELLRRWNEDGHLHVFEDTIQKQMAFNKWFQTVVLTSTSICEKQFSELMHRYISLSCGVFVDEIHRGMFALLTQEQLQLLNNDTCRTPGRAPLVVHGAAGTGKTLLVLRKLQQLYQDGKLNKDNRALYICYWPGIRLDIQLKLKALELDEYVDTTRFYISLTDRFLTKTNSNYKHIFMDEAEAICLAFSDTISHNTIAAICARYHDGNCKIPHCKNNDLAAHTHVHDQDEWGELWFLVDINQASLFLPKFSPNLLKTPTIILTKVMRSTASIFNLFKQFYSVPMPLLPQNLVNNSSLSAITIGHHINGPPTFWVNSDEIPSENQNKRLQLAVVRVITDLCGSKGLTPNEICVIPFLFNEYFMLDSVNKEIDRLFVENGFRPNATGDVEEYLMNRKINDFLVAWALRVKGLEFKVVVMVFGEGEFELQDAEDRKKTYIMASRCTCLLVLVAPKAVRDALDEFDVTKEYPFGISF